MVDPECEATWTCEAGSILTSVPLGCAEHASCVVGEDGFRECQCDEDFIGQ